MRPRRLKGCRAAGLAVLWRCPGIGVDPAPFAGDPAAGVHQRVEGRRGLVQPHVGPGVGSLVPPGWQLADPAERLPLLTLFRHHADPHRATTCNTRVPYWPVVFTREPQ